MRLVSAVLIAVLGLGVWGGIGLTRHAIIALDRWGEAAEGIKATTVKLNGKAGTIAKLDEDLGAVKSATIHADLIARHEQQQLSTLDTQERQLFADLHGTMGAATRTLDAASQSAQEATLTFGTMNHAIAQTQPLIEASTATVSHADKLVSDPALMETLRHINGTAQHVEGISGDTQRITDDLTRKYFEPVPWWKKSGDMLELAWKAYMTVK